MWNATKSFNCLIDDIDIPLLEGRAIFMNRKGYGEIKLRRKGVLVQKQRYGVILR